MKDHDPPQTDVDPWSELESAWRDDGVPTSAPGAEPAPSKATESEIAVVGITVSSQRIARMARRELWIRWALRISEALIFVIFGGLSLKWIALGPWEMRPAGAFVITLLLATFWIRRQTFFDLRREPTAQAPVHFVETLLEHNREGYRGLRFGKILLAIQVAFFVLWMTWIRDPARPGDTLENFAFLALWAIIFLIALHLARRYLDRQRRQLEELRDQLQSDNGSNP